MNTTKKITINFVLNGKPSTFEAYPMDRLIDLLREQKHHTGTKEGCGEGECGACSVLMNGELVNSCLIPAIQVEGSAITTIEGIGNDQELAVIQDAFVELGGVQCGICTPGMILATVYLLKNNAQPSEAQVREALAGNICRCTGYMKIFDAVSAACKKAKVVT